jgi:predicted phage terminase large subunit-like protein
VPLEGGIIKRDWIVKNHYNSQDQFNRFSLNQFDLIIGSWDLTFSNTGDSWNVGIVVGKKGSDKYVLDMWRGRYDIIQQRDAIREMYAKYPQIRAMLIEKKANGEAVQRVLRREIPGILLIDPRDIGAGDKEARLSACAIDFEANNVKFPHPSLPGCSWVELAIDELTLFPKTPNDDIVDAVSMALNWLASKSNNRMTIAANATNFFSNNSNPQEKAKFEGKVAPSKEELDKDGSFLQIVEASDYVVVPSFNTSGLKSYKSIFN